jgi:predicted RNA-binding protein with RPS1 domain
MTTTVERGKWATLGKKLEKIVVENNSKPKSEKKPLKELFEDFANEHDTTFSSTQQYYYTDIRPNINKVKNFDENIEEFNRTNNPDPIYRSVKDVHKIGDTAEIEITNIRDFGAFAKTDQGYEGLIHISQITGKEYVALPEDFFYVGEKLKAKVLRYDGEKLSLSTKALGGKEKLNPAFKDLANREITSEPTPAPKPEPRKAVVPQIEKKPIPTSVTNNDKDNIINFIKKYSDNNVSQKALGDIDDLIEQFGVFQTTMVLMSTVRDLDISSFITEMTKERLEGEYLRQL